MLRKLPFALGVGVLLMKSLRVALPPSTAWFVGMPLLDTMRFSFTTQRNNFQEKQKSSGIAAAFFALYFHKVSEKIVASDVLTI